MTLVLSCLTHQFVVQVSDCRITDGLNPKRTIDDHRNKGTLYCSNLGFAYSGVAELDGKYLDLWMAEVLAQVGPDENPISLLQKRVTASLRNVHHVKDKRLALVAIGWDRTSENSPFRPVQITISNALNKNWGWLKQANDEFEVNGFMLKEDTPFALGHPIGVEVPKDILDNLKKNISLCIKHKVGPLEYIRLLAEAIHEVVRRRERQKKPPTVGKNLIAMVLPKSAAENSKIFFFTPLNWSATHDIDQPMFLHISDDLNNMVQHAPNFVCEGTAGIFSSVDTDSVTAHITQAINKAEAGYLRVAISDFTDVIEADPFNSNAYLNRGIAYTRLNKLKEAISDFDRIIELDPKNVDAYYNRGTAHGQSNNLIQAIFDLNEAINLDPDNANAYINRGIVYGKSNNLKQAISDFEYALKLVPDSAKAFYNRGFAYAASGNLQLAISDFDQVIELDSSNARVYFDRGVAHTGLNNFKKALVDLDKAIELGLGDARIYYRRGVAYVAIGNFGKAVLDYEKYLELTPDAQDRGIVMNIVEQLKSELKHKKQVE